MNKKLQVFVSSTYRDLIEERQAVIDTILELGHVPIAMEFFPLNTHDTLKQTLLELIKASDLFILILGRRYGMIDETSGQSYLQLEYIYAINNHIPVFTIILEDNYLSKKIYANNNFIFEKDSTNISLYKKFKTLLMAKTVRIVSNKKNLINCIYAILYEFNKFDDYIYSKSTYYKQDSDIFVKKFYKNISNKGSFCLNSINPGDKPFFFFHNTKKSNSEKLCNLKYPVEKCILNQFGKPFTGTRTPRININEINRSMLIELKNNPADLYKLTSRRFEELIAKIFIRKKYKVELTPATRDGGKDIYISFKNDFGSFLYVLECKKYNPTHKVGVSVLRDLYGILSKENATYGIAVTTSYFSKPAIKFQQDLQYKMSLHDFESIKQWLCDVT